MPPTTKASPESSSSTESSPERSDLDNNRRFWDLRGVQWRTDLGVLPSSSSVDDVRRVTANSRRSYAALRRRLLLDPLIPKDGNNVPDLVMDNPLSQDPDSMWGQFFQKAEIEKMVDQDLSRLYPEHGSYFQTPVCQGVLRRILLLWCITHPNYGYRQGMHELLAPLLFVLQADVERLSAVRKLYQHYYTDNFDGLCFHQTDSYKSNLKQISQHINSDNEINESQPKVNNINELDPKIQTIISFSDAYGAEGELGIVLSEKFMEHDAYSMFDALMNGSNGAVAMASFFSPNKGSLNGLPPVIEASYALYQLLSIVDSSLYTHLIELKVEPQYFALRWLRVLFGREFALEDLLVIWDEIFSFDNSKFFDGNDENAPGTTALSSSRGAFIAALAVSMILYIRSSILATETATSCLQRLLNFPQDVNLSKLLKKANSLVVLAIDAIKSMPPPVYDDGVFERRKSDVAVSGSPLSVVRESYWEEKWRNLHKKEEKKEIKSLPKEKKEISNRNNGWSVKGKSPLLRTESDPSSSKVFREKNGSSKLRVRRNLLSDLSRQLGFEEEIENSVSEDEGKKVILTGNGGSEENSSIFSDPPSPIDVVNDNESESSVASNLSNNENGPEVVSDLPVSDAPESTNLKVVENENGPENKDLKGVENENTGKLGVNLKERILSSGKFQWFWKFGRNNGGEGVSDSKNINASQDNKSEVVDSVADLSDEVLVHENKTVSVEENITVSVQENKTVPVQENKTCSLKNLGQSMVENLQVIESVFQEEKGEITHVDNLSKKALVDRGQMTAMAALKELRKISNILSEM